MEDNGEDDVAAMVLVVPVDVRDVPANETVDNATEVDDIDVKT